MRYQPAGSGSGRPHSTFSLRAQPVRYRLQLLLQGAKIRRNRRDLGFSRACVPRHLCRAFSNGFVSAKTSSTNLPPGVTGKPVIPTHNPGGDCRKLSGQFPTVIHWVWADPRLSTRRAHEVSGKHLAASSDPVMQEGSVFCRRRARTDETRNPWCHRPWPVREKSSTT